MKGDVYHGNEPSPRDWVVQRVEIPVYHDAWHRGDRYGDVTRLHHDTGLFGQPIVIAFVRLDRCGELERCIYKDCKVLP